MKNNKGEWSEFYVFLKILEEKKIVVANKKLEKIPDKFFHVHEIIRSEKNESVKRYEIQKSTSKIFILNENGDVLKKFDSSLLKNKALKLFERIKNETSSSFDIPEAEELMRDLLCTKVKVANDKKADLVAVNEKIAKYALSLSNYEYKIKNFLIAVALGMIPSKPWDGFSQAHGGYIVVKKNGEIVCYHLYNYDEFRAYLYENTAFDTPSSTRYDFGKLYQKNKEWFFKLGLQIRFLN